MTKLYNQKKVAENTASVGNQTTATFTYKGFSSSEKAKGFKLYDIDLVKQDIINHFYIRKGEKLENPTFGTVIWDMIYEPFTEDTKNIISKDVEAIVNFDPRVNVTAVTVDSTEFGMRVEVEMVYLPFNISERMSFDFDKNTNTIN
jgi:phage baseplate assembly protein W